MTAVIPPEYVARYDVWGGPSRREQQLLATRTHAALTAKLPTTRRRRPAVFRAPRSLSARVEAALARTGTVLGAMNATGATYEQVRAVKSAMETANKEGVAA